MNSNPQKHLVSHHNNEENLVLPLKFSMVLLQGGPASLQQKSCPVCLDYREHLIGRGAEEAVAYIPYWRDSWAQEEVHKEFLLDSKQSMTLLRYPFVLALLLLRITPSSRFTPEGSRLCNARLSSVILLF